MAFGVVERDTVVTKVDAQPRVAVDGVTADGIVDRAGVARRVADKEARTVVLNEAGLGTVVRGRSPDDDARTVVLNEAGLPAPKTGIPRVAVKEKSTSADEWALGDTFDSGGGMPSVRCHLQLVKGCREVPQLAGRYPFIAPETRRLAMYTAICCFPFSVSGKVRKMKFLIPNEGWLKKSKMA